MVLNKGIWYPKPTLANIKGANLKPLPDTVTTGILSRFWILGFYGLGLRDLKPDIVTTGIFFKALDFRVWMSLKVLEADHEILHQFAWAKAKKKPRKKWITWIMSY